LDTALFESPPFRYAGTAAEASIDLTPIAERLIAKITKYTARSRPDFRVVHSHKLMETTEKLDRRFNLWQFAKKRT
jgi:hypothetical protein